VTVLKRLSSKKEEDAFIYLSVYVFASLQIYREHNVNNNEKTGSTHVVVWLLQSSTVPKKEFIFVQHL
jgi:hypothetical protein